MTGARRQWRAIEDFCTQVETGHEALPEFFRILRPYVDSDHAAYFLADERGRIAGAYHEVPQHSPQASEFIERARSGTDARVAHDPPSVGDMFRMDVPVQLLRFDGAMAEESALFRDVIRPIGGRHVLRVGVRVRNRPAGVLALVRGRTSRSFTDEDVARTVRVARPLRRLAHRPPADDERLLQGEGIVRVTPSGRPRQANREGWRLWELVEDERFLPRVDASVVVRSLLEGSPDADGERRTTIRGGWGDFEFEVLTLSATQGDRASSAAQGASDDLCLVRVRHWILARLVYLRRMSELGFSPMQKLVGMDLVNGTVQSDIAADHGIGLQTVITHTRAIYAKAGVSSRTELVAKLRAVAARS